MTDYVGPDFILPLPTNGPKITKAELKAAMEAEPSGWDKEAIKKLLDQEPEDE